MHFERQCIIFFSRKPKKNLKVSPVNKVGSDYHKYSYCDRWMSDIHHAPCGVCHQQLLQRTSPPKLLAGFLPNLVGRILIWPSLKIVQIFPIHCISSSQRLKIDFQDESFKKSSGTTRPRTLILAM